LIERDDVDGRQQFSARRDVEKHDMPPRMTFGSPASSIERDNKLGERPVVRQSKIYRERESGNGMKGALGQGHLAWDANQLQGTFKGQAVYDATQAAYNQGQARNELPPARPEFGGKHAKFAPGIDGPSRETGNGPMRVPPQQQQQQQQRQMMMMQTQEPEAHGEAEYPLPGSTASCDLCGDVVNRFYHCAECREEQGGLFDLCVVCCGAVYLKQGKPELLQRARQLRHPTHNFQTHPMVHVTPNGR
jgi:hypothetical protein